MTKMQTDMKVEMVSTRKYLLRTYVLAPQERLMHLAKQGVLNIINAINL